MAWSKVNTKFKKPLGWWYHKVMCELKYHLKGGGTGYYYHLNKMCDNYHINLYGERLPKNNILTDDKPKPLGVSSIAERFKAENNQDEY